MNCDYPDVLEIWNLVFIQFNREQDGSLRSLPNKHVDTGMGFERLASVLQHKRSNYDTDVFTYLFDAIREGTGTRPYSGLVGKEDIDGIDMAYRVVADHIRTLTFALSDGGVPSNEGRGYVLRRILRRAIRYSHEKLSAKPGFFPSLVNVVVDKMGGAFSELTRNPQSVIQILMEEETQFRKTLERGIQVFTKMAEKASQEGRSLSGKEAWMLYDTFGFPSDLTRLMAEERGLLMTTMDDYLQEEARAREMSRGATKSNESDAVILNVHHLAELETVYKIPTTVDKFKYDDVDDGKSSLQAKVQLFLVDNAFTTEAEPCNINSDKNNSNSKCNTNANNSISNSSTGQPKRIGILLNQTNFYAEQGGQLFDTGTLVNSSGEIFHVENVQSYGGYVLHVGYLEQGRWLVDDKVTCLFDDKQRRQPIRRNHTATHLLNFALRDVLGDSVEQRGSLVAPDRLRFDFNSLRALEMSDITRIERIVQDFIDKKDTVYSEPIPLALAKKITGLRAIFGEVYPDPVRVVSVGIPIQQLTMMTTTQESLNGKLTSIEFCGGTHVKNTKDIGRFYIITEEGIAKGTRRLVAITGDEAIQAQEIANEFEERLNAAAAATNILEKDLMNSVNLLMKEVETLSIRLTTKLEFRQRLVDLKKRGEEKDKASRANLMDRAIQQAKQLGEKHAGASFLIEKVDWNADIKVILQAIQYLKTVSPETAVLFVSPSDDAQRVLHIASVPEALVKKGLKATEWAKVVSEKVGGKSGGKEILAQGQGTEVNAIDDACDIAKAFAQLKLH